MLRKVHKIQLVVSETTTEKTKQHNETFVTNLLHPIRTLDVIGVETQSGS